ncbi:MAG: hypothetical protein RM338_05620 [Nostoc sp. DedQUE12a]|nr:hypothetical protein [Nostoc sp. DedQUE12a]
MYACMQEALERRCDKAFGEERSEDKRNLLLAERATWGDARGYCREAHYSFINACKAWTFNAAIVHNMITVAVCGKTAGELREMEVIEGDDDIGLNHVKDIETLVKIARMKHQFSGYQSGTASQRIERAAEIVLGIKANKKGKVVTA